MGGKNGQQMEQLVSTMVRSTWPGQPLQTESRCSVYPKTLPLVQKVTQANSAESQKKQRQQNRSTRRTIMRPRDIIFNTSEYVIGSAEQQLPSIDNRQLDDLLADIRYRGVRKLFDGMSSCWAQLQDNFGDLKRHFSSGPRHTWRCWRNCEWLSEGLRLHTCHLLDVQSRLSPNRRLHKPQVPCHRFYRVHHSHHQSCHVHGTHEVYPFGATLECRRRSTTPRTPAATTPCVLGYWPRPTMGKSLL